MIKLLFKTPKQKIKSFSYIPNLIWNWGGLLSYGTKYNVYNVFFFYSSYMHIFIFLNLRYVLQRKLQFYKFANNWKHWGASFNNHLGEKYIFWQRFCYHRAIISQTFLLSYVRLQMSIQYTLNITFYAFHFQKYFLLFQWETTITELHLKVLNTYIWRWC